MSTVDIAEYIFWVLSLVVAYFWGRDQGEEYMLGKVAELLRVGRERGDV